MLWEVVEILATLVPDAWTRFQFRRFWGQGIQSGEAFFVIDSYEDVRLRNGLRYAEAQSLPSAQPVHAQEIIHGTFAPQAAAALTELFLRHAGRRLRIGTDSELHDKKDATLICYGTSDSNYKTFDIEATSENDLCRFLFNGSGQRAFHMGGRTHSIERRDGVIYDKAILLRLVNRQYPQHCSMVCAGLSEWGSLASVHYLAKNWKTLHRRFDRFGQRRDFCVLLEVPFGQFENAREVATAAWWEPKTRPQRNGGLRKGPER